MGKDEDRGIGVVTMRAFVLGALLAGVFAWMTVMRDNADPTAKNNTFLSGNLIPVLPHAMLLLAGILVNPLLRRLKIIREFCKAELLLIFLMCAVSAGLASWGLTGKLIPEVSALSNQAWNTDQSQWDIHAMPFLNENYFIAEKGSQEAAKRLRAAHLRYEEARKLYQTARDLTIGKAELVKIEAELEEISRIPDAKERAIQQRVLAWPHGQAIKLVQAAAEKWEEIGGDLDVQVVVETYSEKIASLKAERDALRAELKELNAPATEAVELFRKGLPSEKRAFPGFFYSGGEGVASYSARIKRLRVGTKSLDRLREVADTLAAVIEDGSELPTEFAAGVAAAAGMLEEISDIPALSGLNEKLSAELEKVEDRIADQKVEGRHLRHLRRYSKQSQFEAFNDRIAELDSSTAELEKQATALTDRLEKQIRPLLEVCERVRTTQAELLAIATDSKDMEQGAYPDLRGRVDASIASYEWFDASARRFWFGDVKWQIWLRPVFNWVILAFLGYLVLMAFNTLIFRQWAHNEKLIYPLAEIASVAAGGSSPEDNLKPLYRSGLFWFGFTVPVVVLGWNFLASNHIVPNINPIKLESAGWSAFGSGPLRGLQAFYFCIIFAVIGVSFLVPSSISFSLWFFEILFMALVLILVWLGYGGNRQSFNHVRQGLGNGGMLVFGMLILWTCKRYLLCAFRPSVLKGLDPDEAKELRVSSAIFLGGSAILLGIMTFAMGTNPLMTILFFLVTLTIIIALIRVVAEGGILGVEGGTSAFGLIKTLTGASSLWGVTTALAPLGIYMGYLFGGTKAFIAPLMANSLKLREQFKMRRLHFHGAIWAGLTIAALISVITLVIISYDRGADNLHGWLNSASAKGAINGVKAAGSGVVQAAKPGTRAWMISGVVVMALLLLARRRFFGIPHPIGLLMLMNMSMLGFWGSIMLGWLFKSLVSKYCSHEQYLTIRRFFIGLVLGHMLCVLFGWDPMEFHWG